MNEAHILGRHMVFYYYGVEHLALNLDHYITEGIQAHEWIYISMEPELFQQVMRICKWENCQTAIRFYSGAEFILIFQESGLAGLTQMFNRLREEALRQGYQGIRFIGQSQFSLPQTSPEEYLAWENALNAVLKDTPTTFLCVCDMQDILHDSSLAYCELIAHSLEVHPYIFYQFQIKEMHSFIL